MNARPLKAALLTTAILGAVLAPAAAASAQSLTVDDGTADTWENVYNPDTQSDDWFQAGSKLNTDITQTVVKHSAKRITITATYADLKSRDARYGLKDRLRFDHGPQVVADVDTNGTWKGQAYLFTKNSGAMIKCTGLTHAIDYTADTVEISIPRSCVGNPTWVEAAEVSLSSVSDDAGDHVYMDNGNGAGHQDGTWTAKVRRG